jgi:DNA topoisomerase II
MKVKNFFDEALREFSAYNVERSIPSLVDGLKPSQRKVVHALLKRGESAGEMKVAQLAAYTAAETAYKHGEKSIEDTIVTLAQTHPGTNNLNLLSPEGQFGSRLTPEAASSRYIFTKLSPNFRKLFLKEDDCTLSYLDDDGDPIEPRYYVPILPTVLVNGSTGVGTGYASNILCYNPTDLRDYIQSVLRDGVGGDAPLPWFRGFKGSVSKAGNKVEITGVLEVVNSNTIRITELPVGTHLDKYKTILNKLEDEQFVKSYKDTSNEESFNFELKVPRTTTDLPMETLLTKFKLVGKVTENFTLWDEKGYIKTFANVEELILHFVLFRLDKYEERRLKLIELWKQDLAWLLEKIRFIEFYIENSTDVSKMKKSELIEVMAELGFTSTDRLLSIKVYNLTSDEIEALRADIEKVEARIKEMESTDNVTLYLKDLKAFKP